MCTPSFPARRDLLQQYTKKFDPIVCFYYARDMFEAAFRGGEWGFIWRTYGGTALVTALSAATLITVTGLIGQYKCNFP